MNNLIYTMHVLLNSKHRLLLSTLLYISLVFIYNILLSDFTFVECMNQNTDNSPQTMPSSINEQIRNLQNENQRLNEYINVLLRELRYNIEERFAERNSYESTIQNATTEIRELRQNLHNSSLALAETNRVVNRLAQENSLLRNILNQEQLDYTTGLESNSENT